MDETHSINGNVEEENAPGSETVDQVGDEQKATNKSYVAHHHHKQVLLQPQERTDTVSSTNASLSPPYVSSSPPQASGSQWNPPVEQVFVRQQVQQDLPNDGKKFASSDDSTASKSDSASDGSSNTNNRSVENASNEKGEKEASGEVLDSKSASMAVHGTVSSNNPSVEIASNEKDEKEASGEDLDSKRASMAVHGTVSSNNQAVTTSGDKQGDKEVSEDEKPSYKDRSTEVASVAADGGATGSSNNQAIASTDAEQVGNEGGYPKRKQIPNFGANKKPCHEGETSPTTAAPFIAPAPPSNDASTAVMEEEDEKEPLNIEGDDTNTRSKEGELLLSENVEGAPSAHPEAVGRMHEEDEAPVSARGRDDAVMEEALDGSVEEEQDEGGDNTNMVQVQGDSAGQIQEPFSEESEELSQVEEDRQESTEHEAPQEEGDEVEDAAMEEEREEAGATSTGVEHEEAVADSSDEPQGEEEAVVGNEEQSADDDDDSAIPIGTELLVRWDGNDYLARISKKWIRGKYTAAFDVDDTTCELTPDEVKQGIEKRSRENRHRRRSKKNEAKVDQAQNR